ncbi:hypothetical protein JHK87_055411 [Glycine soja]|nr:hypothetical protein JHK87_055411 [Glycine soja]
MGLDPAKYLGKELAFLNAYLHKLKELYGINVCCEGGEYETLILDYPLFSVKKGEIVMKGQVRYFELKQLILLSYCQVITFYLLLKSKGQPVYDHPIIARLEEIKKLLDQLETYDDFNDDTIDANGEARLINGSGSKRVS